MGNRSIPDSSRAGARDVSLAIALALAGATAIPERAWAQETCYQEPNGRITTRRRPGAREIPCPAPGVNRRDARPPDAPPSGDAGATGPGPEDLPPERWEPTVVSPVPRPGMTDYVQAVPIPDRWRIVDALGYPKNLWDPYNQNVLKGDKPVHDGDWFFNVSAISDTVFEYRNVVTPVGGSATARPGSIDVFGSPDQSAVIQTLAVELVYYKGNTVFKPPEWEFRLTPAVSINYVDLDEVLGVNADPARGTSRTDYHFGLQAAFVDKHLRDVSERYDFDSLRVGIQPFSSDFRGFLFQDNTLGIRLFGIRENNIWQYNLAWFRRLEKDTNSGLNDLGQPLRKDDVFIANLYKQDFPALGFQSQATIAYNRNRESDDLYYDKNGLLMRPASLGRDTRRDYDVTYVGYSGDGHFGRLNLTTSLYYAYGKEEPGVFVPRETDIRAGFAAAELSMDFDWIRPRVSLLYGSGDDDPFDDRATGFDAIVENPQFAGADMSYWIRQAVPLAGGGRVTLSGRNGVLNSLRSTKDEGQSNFTNPGVILAGIGADLDLTPQLRLTLNANHVQFVDTAVVEVARNQGGIDKDIGLDLSASLIWRPFMTQNIVVRASYATLIAGDGFEQLFPGEDPGYFLMNVLLAY
jgi:hypothetical protein